MSDNHKTTKDYIPFTQQEERLIKALRDQRDKAELKFPLLTGLLVTFGFVSVLYGFEKMIDNITFLSENPVILLFMGLTILGVTGAVYKKLN